MSQCFKNCIFRDSYLKSATPKEEWGIEISTKTVKRVLKEMKMSWHRMRRGVGGEPLPHIY